MTPAEELALVKRRDAEFRLKTVKDFLVLDATLREARTTIDQLNDELGRRNTYIHELHSERESLVRREQAAFGDVEVFVGKLAAAEASLAEARRELQRLKAKRSWLSKATAEEPMPVEPFTPAPAVDYLYYLHTSPFRYYRSGPFQLRGWVLPRDGRAVTGIRARVDALEFIGSLGGAEPEVVAQYNSAAANPRPGFTVEFTVPPGRHNLSLEVQTEHSLWHSFLIAPLWGESPAP